MNREIKLPNPACASICKFAMSERCIEHCAPDGDMEMLEVSKEVTLDRMPKPQKREDLSWKARVRLQDVYTEKIIDHLLGKGDIYLAVDFTQVRRKLDSVSSSNIHGRSLPDSLRHSKDSQGLPITSVQDSASDEACEARQNSESQIVGISKVAGRQQ